MAAPVPSIDRYSNADTSLPAAGLNKTFVVQVDIDFSDPFWAAAGLTNAAGGILIAEAQPGWKLVATASEILKPTTTGGPALLSLGDSASAVNMIASINPAAAVGTIVAGAGADTAKFFTAADGIWLAAISGGGPLQTDGIVRISIAVWAMSDQAFPG